MLAFLGAQPIYMCNLDASFPKHLFAILRQTLGDHDHQWVSSGDIQQRLVEDEDSRETRNGLVSWTGVGEDSIMTLGTGEFSSAGGGETRSSADADIDASGREV